MALPGKNALVKVTSDEVAEPISFTDAATTDEGDNVYAITDRDKKYWDRDTAVVVKEDASTVDESDYLVQHCGGKIHFFDAPTGTITVSGAYVTVTTVAEVNDYGYTINCEIVDTSHFKDGQDPDKGYRVRTANLVDATGTLSGFYVVDNLLEDYLLDSDVVILEFDVDTEADDYDPGQDKYGEVFACYAVLESKELAAAIEGAVGQSVSWQSDGDLLVEQK